MGGVHFTDIYMLCDFKVTLSYPAELDGMWKIDRPWK